MAQIVGYYQDNVTFEEGPFVAVDAWGWRIEVEQKGAKCPVLPDRSIYNALRRHKGKKPGKLDTFEEIAPYVDWLNQMVREGKITLEGRCWVWTG